MNAKEAAEYARQLLKDEGASDEEITLAMKLFDRSKFAQGFIPRPEVDRALTTEKENYKNYKARNEYLEGEWLPSAKQAEAQAKAVVAKYNKYVELYGDIDTTDPNAVKRAAAASGVSKEDLLELLDQRLSARDQATLDLMQIREDYMDRFKKRLPLKDFEKHVGEVRKAGNADSLQAIYKDWISDDVEKLTPHRFSEDDLKARDKRIAEDAIKDFASRNHVPVDQKPKEPHLLFDSAKLKSERDKANGQAKTGREAFLEVLNDPEPDTVRSRYPV